MEQSTKIAGLSAVASDDLSPTEFLLFSEDGILETASPNLARQLKDAVQPREFVEMVSPVAAFGVSLDNPGPQSGQVQFQARLYDVVWTSLADGRCLVSLSPAVIGEATAAEKALHTDPLTGLLTRAALGGCFEEFCNQAADNGAEIFCLYLDLDRFKKVNDTLGHGVGDELLKKVAKRLLRCIRDTDTAIRLGGDEFLVLGAASEPVRMIEDMGRRIVEHLSRPYLLSGNQAVIGASVGASIRAEGTDIEELLKQADLALYQSKRTGRGRMTFYDATIEDQADMRRNLDIALRQALVLDAFEVHYQPQYCLETDRIIGFEALLRLREEDGTLKDAGSFLELAEETRLIVRVGKYVMTQAVRAAGNWPDGIRVSVNVSLVELQHGDLAQHLQRLVAEYGVDPRRISIEIRESALACPSEETAAALRAIAQLGVELVVDKLGDANSTVHRLFLTSFASVKLNKSRLGAMSTDRESAMAGALVELARAAGAQVVADTVETAEQLALAKSMGCEVAQGFVLRAPMPLEEAISLVETQPDKSP